MSTREEKKQARIERYRRCAENAISASNAAYYHSNQLVANIPLGQPIQPGRRGIPHRKTLDKSWEAMGKSVKLSEKAEYYERKAEAAENNDAIYLEDENAVEKLTAKIDELEKKQEFMKAVNKIVRSKKFTDMQKVEQIKALGVSEERAVEVVNVPDWSGTFGFARFSLTNNSANIRRYKERLEQAKKLQETETKDYEINGVKVCENTEENRLQLFFNGKPSDEMRQELKHNAFRWSPYNGCWQSYLNRWQIDRAKRLLNPAL